MSMQDCGPGARRPPAQGSTRDESRETLHRASHMMIRALAEALGQRPGFKPELTVIGTTSGGMSYGEDYYRSLCRNGNPGTRRPGSRIARAKAGIDAQEAFGISAPCQIIANACASGTNAIGHAYECVRSGRYQRVLTGGYDALSELVFVGFDSLQASTAEKCRPLIEIARVWSSGRAQRFCRWKISMSLGNAARPFARK